jgi:hypothetical protein
MRVVSQPFPSPHIPPSFWRYNRAQPPLTGILSTWIFTDAPRFKKATRLNLAMAIGMAVFALGLDIWLRSRNKAKRTQIEAMGGVEKVRASDTSEERLRLGDKHPLFMYTL